MTFVGMILSILTAVTFSLLISLFIFAFCSHPLGIVAVLRIVNSAYEQAPLIAGLVIYGSCILSTAARFGM
jgi:hypothetical protein